MQISNHNHCKRFDTLVSSLVYSIHQGLDHPCYNATPYMYSVVDSYTEHDDVSENAIFLGRVLLRKAEYISYSRDSQTSEREYLQNEKTITDNVFLKIAGIKLPAQTKLTVSKVPNFQGITEAIKGIGCSVVLLRSISDRLSLKYSCEALYTWQN